MLLRLLLLIVVLGAGVAPAQPYPSRVIRIVVGFPSGGPSDVVARVVAQPLSDRLGRRS